MMKKFAGKQRFVCRGRVEYYSPLVGKRTRMGASDIIWAFDEDDAREKFKKKLGSVELQDCVYDPDVITVEPYHV